MRQQCFPWAVWVREEAHANTHAYAGNSLYSFPNVTSWGGGDFEAEAPEKSPGMMLRLISKGDLRHKASEKALSLFLPSGCGTGPLEDSLDSCLAFNKYIGWK